MRNPSKLQVAILNTLAAKKYRLTTKELVWACFRNVSRSENRRAYQSAFASMSRAITRLEERKCVARRYPERAGNNVTVELLARGRVWVHKSHRGRV